MSLRIVKTARGRYLGRMIPAAMLAAILVAGARANTPPVLNAGDDRTWAMRVATTFYLGGDVSDDGSLLPEPEVLWSLIDGPATATIASPATLFTSVEFTAAGVYRFRLQAYDGEFTAYDTVIVTVERSVPLRVLHPAPGENVTPGAPYTVQWEMYPIEGMVVYLSIDKGITWTVLTEEGVGRNPPCQWVWEVPAGLVGDSCLLKVASYALRDEFATVSGYFLVGPTNVNHSGPSIHARPSPRAQDAGQCRVTVNGRSAGGAAVALSNGVYVPTAGRCGSTPRVIVR